MRHHFEFEQQSELLTQIEILKEELNQQMDKDGFPTLGCSKTYELSTKLDKLILEYMCNSCSLKH